MRQRRRTSDEIARSDVTGCVHASVEIAHAVDAVALGLSIRQAAAQYGVPVSTVGRRCKKAGVHSGLSGGGAVSVNRMLYG